LMENWWRVDEAAYRRYENLFIRSGDAPNLSLWEIFCQFGQAGTVTGDRLDTGVTR
jgi:hypothetical protein